MVDFNEIIKRRTKKNVISEIIAIVVFALLNIAFKAYSIEYNVDLLKEQDVYAPYVHKFCETINPKIALKDFVCYDRRLEASINTICENEVGKTLIRRMYDAYLSNLNNGIFKPVKIFRDCVLLDGILERNITCHYDSEIKIYIDPDNLSSYVGYKNGNIEEMPSTLDSVIFHEMCHAFHDLTSSLKLDSKIPTLKHTYSYSKKDCVYLWTNKDKPNDEELYNITGYFYENGRFKFDPINCNMYEICKACEFSDSRDKISQRIFHKSYAECIFRFSVKRKLLYRSLKKSKFFIDLSIWVLDKE